MLEALMSDFKRVSVIQNSECIGMIDRTNQRAMKWPLSAQFIDLVLMFRRYSKSIIHNHRLLSQQNQADLYVS